MAGDAGEAGVGEVGGERGSVDWLCVSDGIWGEGSGGDWGFSGGGAV